MFWDPSKHRRNKGKHPHYRDREYTLLIDKDVPPSPVAHVMRPREQLARFDDANFRISAYDPHGPKDDIQYHPKWKGWVVPEPPRIVETKPDVGIYVVPLMPKNIPLGDDIPEHEEWIKPFNPGDDNPNTVQDEQVWANTKHKFVFNALPITDMRPYKPNIKRARIKSRT